jgi:hypothetical protein
MQVEKKAELRDDHLRYISRLTSFGIMDTQQKIVKVKELKE